MRSPEEEKRRRDAGFAAHERDQVQFIARNTTPTQRIQWMEQTLLALGPERLKKMRELRDRIHSQNQNASI
ncbi:hypothetical protein BH10PLA1_BH10PLA1_01930 [soil metagenome]